MTNNDTQKTQGQDEDEVRAAIQSAAEANATVLPEPWSKKKRPFSVTTANGTVIEYK